MNCFKKKKKKTIGADHLVCVLEFNEDGKDEGRHTIEEVVISSTSSWWQKINHFCDDFILDLF
jgi:hypothetical protein